MAKRINGVAGERGTPGGEPTATSGRILPVITVRRVPGQLRIGYPTTWVWRWSCTEHPRHRGYHHAGRMRDHIRAQYGKPSDPTPFERAIAGAVAHWHRFHDPTGPCSCCAPR